MAKKTLVRELMMQDVKTISQNKTVSDAVKLMVKYNIGALIVVDRDNHTVGIFTERDLLRKVVAHNLEVTTPLSDVMTADLVCAQMQDEMDHIPDMMVKGGFRHVPVVDGFEPVGILSIRDVLRYILAR